MAETIFDKIVSGEIPAYKIWENESHLAFLTPFPNTPGASVVIPKASIGDYIFELSSSNRVALIDATSIVAKLLEKAFETPRIALVFEGTGVPYVHAKLYPLIGELGAKTDVTTGASEFFPEYAGYLSTIEGPRMEDEKLIAIQTKIRAQQ